MLPKECLCSRQCQDRFADDCVRVNAKIDLQMTENLRSEPVQTSSFESKQCMVRDRSSEEFVRISVKMLGKELCSLLFLV